MKLGLLRMDKPVPWRCLWYLSFVSRWLASQFPFVGTTSTTFRIWILPIPLTVLHAWMSTFSLVLTCIGSLSPVRLVVGILDLLLSTPYLVGCCQDQCPPLHEMCCLLALLHTLCVLMGRLKMCNSWTIDSSDFGSWGHLEFHPMIVPSMTTLEAQFILSMDAMK